MCGPRCAWANSTIITPPQVCSPLGQLPAQIKTRVVPGATTSHHKCSVALWSCLLQSCTHRFAYCSVTIFLLKWFPYQNFGNSSCDHEVDSFERFTSSLMKGSSLPLSVFVFHKFSLCSASVFPLWILICTLVSQKCPLSNSPSFWLGRSGCYSECFCLRVCWVGLPLGA